MAINKTLRFEVFKRDGFRCRYCGSTAADKILEADHVIPICEGGPTEASNLVTACMDCNRGKSGTPLDKSKLVPPVSTEAMLEHAEQIRGYLAAVALQKDACKELIEVIEDLWIEAVGDNLDYVTKNALPHWIGAIGFEQVVKAVSVVGSARYRVHSREHKRRYFLAVMRNMPGWSKAAMAR